MVAESSCASEGMVEVLIEPQLPQPSLAVVGESPAAATLRELAGTIGWRVTSDLTAGVASAKRAGVELAALRERGLDEETLARVRSPAGLDLGPLSQTEIAVAVLAELVAWRHDRASVGELPLEAVDPVCGMRVAVTAGTPSVEHEGTTYWFCRPGCGSAFAGDPARYLASA